VISFEASIFRLFNSVGQDFQHDAQTNCLKSNKLNIEFIANPADTEYVSKINNCQEENKLTIRLWQDIYQSNRQVVNSRILALLGKSERIYARTTSIRSITQPVLAEFLNLNHLNKAANCKFKYGLFVANRLVAVAAFGRSCPIQHDGRTYISHELIRYCSLINHTIVGGLSKLISHFVKTQKPQHLMTYVDREWSQGKSYLQMGFQVESITAHKIFWIGPDNKQRIDSLSLSQNIARQELTKKGWQCVENLGNIKLVKFIS